MNNFKTRLQNRDCPARTVKKRLLEINSLKENIASTEKQNRAKESTTPPSVA